MFALNYKMFDFSKYVGKALTQSRQHVHLNLGGKVFTRGEPKDHGGKSICHRDAISMAKHLWRPKHRWLATHPSVNRPMMVKHPSREVCSGKSIRHKKLNDGGKAFAKMTQTMLH